MTNTSALSVSRLPALIAATMLIVVMLLQASPADASGGYERVVNLMFPVAGSVSFSDTYDANRGGSSAECLAEGVSGRKHQATDILAPKLRKVHAAQAGTVVWAPESEPSYGWMITVRGVDGLDYSYIHLNDDRPGSDDGRGGITWAYAPGVRKGATVARGQFIGYVGDSGNAESVSPHLHFEIFDPDLNVDRLACPYVQGRLNPYPSLVAARDRGDLPGQAWVFSDVDPQSTHGPHIEALVAAGITAGCGGGRYCPDRPLTRGEMATFLVKSAGLPAAGRDFFGDDAGSVHEADINALAAAGITSGCAKGRFCPGRPLPRDEMATFLVKTLELPPSGQDRFRDDAGSAHESDINALAASGITAGCSASAFCPDRLVTRAQMASFLVLGLDL